MNNFSINERVVDEYTRNVMCKQLVKKLDNYGFEGPVHYTDFSNLASILRCGCLKSRNKLCVERTTWADSADQGAIASTDFQVKNYVRLFYYYKTPTAWHFENTSRAKGSEQVVLVFKKDILSDSGTRFTDRIAAGHHSDLFSNPGEALLFNWSEIFERGSLPSYNYAEKDRKKKLRQAEFLYPNQLSLDKLEAIYFKSEAKLREAQARFGHNPKFKLDVERKRFNYVSSEVKCA